MKDWTIMEVVATVAIWMFVTTVIAVVSYEVLIASKWY